MPHLQHTFESYGNDIQVISVNLGVNDDLISVKATKKEFTLTVPVVIDVTGELSRSYNLLGTPNHVLLDKNGKILHMGHDTSIAIDNKIKRLAHGSGIEPEINTKKYYNQEAKKKL